MLAHTALYRRLPRSLSLAIAIGTALALGACGSNDDAPAAPEHPPLSIPAAPADQGAPDSVPLPAAVAFVDTAANNQRGDARYATIANKAGYLRRLTYGFPQIGAANAPAMVPNSAEVLLETRLPCLSAAQRRAVLKTTAVPSGYPVMDDPEGWGRLNLFDAADGYGALSGNVVLVMDAARGGFHASDRWRNDIGGSGKLVKQGSGALALTGNNSWSGGTELDAGTLEGTSNTAFGSGAVYVGGGTLRVTFQNGYKPAAGTVLTVMSAASLKGRFSTITVDGATVTPTYSGTALTLRIGG